MIAEQEKRALVEVVQADRDAAAGYYEQAHEHRAGAIVREGSVDHRYIVQAFARHRLAFAAEQDWQPIESAPRDGTPFDAWVSDAFGGKRMIGLSFNHRGQLRQHGLLTPAELPRWPTHWRPLPTPPATPTAKEDGHGRG